MAFSHLTILNLYKEECYSLSVSTKVAAYWTETIFGQEIRQIFFFRQKIRQIFFDRKFLIFSNFGSVWIYQTNELPSVKNQFEKELNNRLKSSKQTG